MGRSHDFHCLDCHDWTSGFDLGAEDRCMGCGSTRIEYDLNCDGCSECDSRTIVGRLVGRQTHADGTEFASFRIVNGSVPGGPTGIGRRYVLVEVTSGHPFWED